MTVAVLPLLDRPLLFLLGASSGGSFAYQFARRGAQAHGLLVMSVCVQIMAVRPLVGDTTPTLFLHMSSSQTHLHPDIRSANQYL
jgi:surfactin synthase thioesterase subunit